MILTKTLKTLIQFFKAIINDFDYNFECRVFRIKTFLFPHFHPQKSLQSLVQFFRRLWGQGRPVVANLSLRSSAGSRDIPQSFPVVRSLLSLFLVSNGFKEKLFFCLTSVGEKVERKALFLWKAFSFFF